MGIRKGHGRHLFPCGLSLVQGGDQLLAVVGLERHHVQPVLGDLRLGLLTGQRQGVPPLSHLAVGDLNGIRGSVVLCNLSVPGPVRRVIRHRVFRLLRHQGQGVVLVRIQTVLIKGDIHREAHGQGKRRSFCRPDRKSRKAQCKEQGEQSGQSAVSCSLWLIHSHLPPPGNRSLFFQSASGVS